jgi:hypothetical protein
VSVLKKLVASVDLRPSTYDLSCVVEIDSIASTFILASVVIVRRRLTKASIERSGYLSVGKKFRLGDIIGFTLISLKAIFA